MSYPKYKLSNITTFISRGVTPKYVENDGYDIINQKCIRNNNLSFEDARLTHKNKTSIKAEKYIQKWDVLVNSTGVGTLGRTAQVKNDYDHTTVDTHVTIVRPNLEKIFGNYFGYIMDYNEPIIESLAKGATGQTELGRKLLKKILITVPSYKEQQKIASILSAFDDLIENNTRRIQILEEMARLIYKEWFVNFRYPGHENVPLVDSPLGKIPKGCEVVQVKDVIEVNPRTSIDKNEERPFLPMGKVSENSMLIDEFGLEKRKGSGGTKFKNNDTLFARITPCLENGKTGFVQFLESDEQVALGSTEFIVLRSKELNPYFVYCLARNERFRESAIKSMAGASGRQRVRIDTVKEFQIPIPPPKYLDHFGSISEPIFKEIGHLAQQNERLKLMRDLLLPNLISGKINIEKIEV